MNSVSRRVNCSCGRRNICYIPARQFPAPFGQTTHAYKQRNPPAVSVILPAFNAEKYLGEAVDSILSQTFADFELIVVNDGSTDRTLEILRDNSDNRIRIVSNDNNLGPAKSMNKGISEARGRYIARQDADDISLPERLQKQFEYMEKHPEVAVLGTGRQTITGSGKIKVNDPPMKSPTFEDMLKSSRIVGPSVMIRKTCLDEVGGYDDFFRQADDYDLWLRLTKKYPAVNLQENVYAIRRNTASLSRGNSNVTMLYRLLARNRAMGTVDDEMFAQIKGNGIESYYKHLSQTDKIFYHQRVAKRCMNYARNAEAMENYRQLMNLQGMSFKALSNMLRLKFRLLRVKYS